jgi:hypothetical protein
VIIGSRRGGDSGRAPDSGITMKLWFGTWKDDEGSTEDPPMSCHGCQSDRVEMTVPVSPEVLSYRCTMCGRQWSVRARTATELGPRTT